MYREIRISNDYNCPFCDASFASAEARAAHEADEHPVKPVKELHNLLDTFESGANKAVQLKHEKELLQEKVQQLEQEQIELEDTLKHVKHSRNRIHQELEEKEHVIRHLKNQLSRKELRAATGHRDDSDQDTTITPGSPPSDTADTPGNAQHPAEKHAESKQRDEDMQREQDVSGKPDTTGQHDTDESLAVDRPGEELTATVTAATDTEQAPNASTSDQINETDETGAPDADDDVDPAALRARLKDLRNENAALESSMEETEQLFQRLRKHMKNMS